MCSVLIFLAIIVCFLKFPDKEILELAYVGCFEIDTQEKVYDSYQDPSAVFVEQFDLDNDSDKNRLYSAYGDDVSDVALSLDGRYVIISHKKPIKKAANQYTKLYRVDSEESFEIPLAGITYAERDSRKGKYRYLVESTIVFNKDYEHDHIYVYTSDMPLSNEISYLASIDPNVKSISTKE